jgi:hypothetical protein
MKIQNALQQEAEGHKLWIQGTLELIRSLDDARKRLGSDQAFGTWLTDNGYGENRITRHDRAALLNMALDLNVTREVLEKTNRRSWRLIWEDEIQNRLPSTGQPPDDKQPDEAPAITRRSKKAKGAKKTTTEEQADEWLRDRQCFFRDGLVTFNNVIAMQNTLRQCTPEQRRKLQEEVDSVWLGKLEQSGEVSLWLRDWFNGALEEEANALIQQGRVKRTPARASASAQSGA